MSVPVTVPCTCTGKQKHPEDTVNLKSEVDTVLGVAVMTAIRETAANRADMVGAIAGAYLANGIESWTFLDADGDGVPIDRETITRHLPWPTSGTVADVAAGIYGEVIFRPLAGTSSTPSSASPTDASTSPIPEPGQLPESPTSVKRSSRNGTAGKRSEAPVG